MSELAPAFRQQFLDNNGLPLAGGQIFTYAAGTTTPLATYTDESGLTPNTNPVILDASGSANIWIGDDSYKFVLEDSLGNSIKTVDNVLSIAAQIAAISSTFKKVTISYTQLQTAGLSNAIQAFSLPARAMLKSVLIKHSTAFIGGSISAVQAQVGPSGAYTNLIEGFDIFQSVADLAFDNVAANFIASFANPTPIYLNAIAVGANLSALTQGSVDIYYDYETF